MTKGAKMSCPNRNFFCYVCALYTPKSNSHPISKTVVTAFEKYFRVAFIPNVTYVPEIVCEYCYRRLTAMLKGNEVEQMRYVRPTIWFSILDHEEDSCYFCLSKKKCTGFKYQNRENIAYADCENVMPAIRRSEEFPYSPMERALREPDEQQQIDLDYSEAGPGTSGLTSEYVPTAAQTPTPHLITQKDYNDLVRDSFMSQTSAEIVGSRLKEWNLVASDFRVTASRKRGNAAEFDACFSIHEETNLVYCNDIEALFECFHFQHVPADWRLFIDGSKASLKAVLLHIGNEHPSIPIAYGRYQKEEYDTIKLMLQLMKYDQYKWKTCCDLKMVAIISGIKKAYSKHQCFLCTWEGRKDDLHYIDHIWQMREDRVIGEYSIVLEPLIEAAYIIIPPLHVKLGLIKNFLKALYRTNPDILEYLTEFFKTQLSAAKVKEGGLNGKQLEKLFKNTEFIGKLSPLEKRAFKGIRKVSENFLGNKRADNYKEIVAEMLAAFKELRVHMSLKIHFLYNHLNFFPDNCGDCSDEQGERFHQDIATIEERFKGKDSTHMMGEYCWSICRDTDPNQHKRKSHRQCFLTLPS